MKNLLLFLTICLTVSLYGQPESISTRKGKLEITPVLHSTMVWQWRGKTIFIDPYGGAARFAGFGAPDLILITDIHGDHMNRETLSDLDLTQATLIAPQAVVDELQDMDFLKVNVLANGQRTTWKGIKISAVPMYNLPESADSRHPKGRGNGYIADIKGTRIYVSGDTEDIPEMRSLENIDVAFVCMNLPFTMTVEQAADAVLDFRPAVVYPFHYRGREGLSDIDQFKRLVNAENSNIEVRLRDWYPTF